MASSTQSVKSGTTSRSLKSQQYEAVIKKTQWPIIYSPEYNIAFCGLERLHPFDAGKWGRIFDFLKEAGMIRDDTIVEPEEAREEELLVVHSKKYLGELRWSVNVASITEVPPVALLPNFIVQRKVLRPFRYQTSGTIMAGRLALERGWAINIGGGFHHCSADKGGGFCAYADITLCIKFAFEKLEGVARAMIIDLDAHQGNGHERDFMNDERVFILDVYNRGIYPHDGFAKRAIARKVELAPFTDDRAYLDSVRRHVEGALNQFEPHLVVYNAGTDILDGDPLGCLSISAQGIIERDQIVFQKCRTRGIPVVMVTSGGYQRQTARIVADSVLNLHSLRLISCDEAENAPLPELPSRDLMGPTTATSLPHSRSDGGLFARFRRSCMSRASSSTNSIPSMNSATGSGVRVGEAESQMEGKLLTHWGSEAACDSAVSCAFGAASDQIPKITAEENAARSACDTTSAAISGDVSTSANPPLNCSHQSASVVAPPDSLSDNIKREVRPTGEGDTPCTNVFQHNRCVENKDTTETAQQITTAQSTAPTAVQGQVIQTQVRDEKCGQLTELLDTGQVEEVAPAEENQVLSDEVPIGVSVQEGVALCYTEGHNDGSGML